MSAAPIDLHWVQKPGTGIESVERPSTINEAVELLAAQPELRPIAGGTDLLLELDRSGTGGNARLLDVSCLEGVTTLDLDDPDIVSIGAGVTHADILSSAAAHQVVFPLAQACLEVGSPQLRNRATIAGNVITASPANDTISALLALDATISIVGLADGEMYRRVLPLAEFSTGFRTTALEPHELVDKIVVPKMTADQRGTWVKSGLRKAQAISVVHAGFLLGFDADGTITSARISLGSVGPTVALSEPAAQILIGEQLEPQVISRAAAAAADGVAPIDDGRATADYRSDTVVTVVSRALQVLADRRERECWPDKIPVLSTRTRATSSGRRQSQSVRSIAAEQPINVTVNGAPTSAATDTTPTLLEWLRANAGTGTKEGCAEGECGACTVQLDDDAVMSCLVPAAQADAGTVVTIEGLAGDHDVHPMQQSFVDKFAVQCGFCIPGFVMAAETLAAEFDSTPTRAELEQALSGNLCRCTGYYNIIDAVLTSISERSVGA